MNGRIKKKEVGLPLTMDSNMGDPFHARQE
jgi:hypothetical protein